MMTNKTKLLPGILNDAIEFFVDEDQVYALSSGKVLKFTDLPFSHIQLLREEIEKDTNVKGHLLSMHPTSEYRRLEQYAKCRYGGLDYEPDILNGESQDGEWWDCPLRGACPSEGVLCKAVKHNGFKIGPIEIKLARLLSTNYTNEVIASEMDLPLGSLHAAKKSLYNKFGVQTKQEITRIAQRLNLI